MRNFEIKGAGSSASTPTMFALMAALGAATTWAVADIKPFRTTHVQSTSDVTFNRFAVPLPDIEPDFTKRMAKAYADLAEGQSALGADFEAAWEANARELYEA